MDFNPTERQKALLEPFRALCGGTIEPEAARIDRERAFPRENIRLLGEAGFLGLLLPETYGGSGEGMLTYAILAEELAKACPTTFLTTMYSALLCGGLIHAFGSDEAKRQYLAGLVSGDLVGAVALTEPGCGSDYEAMQATFAASGDGVTLNGEKMYVTNGAAADLAIVFAREAGDGPIGAFIVERGSGSKTTGFESGEPLMTTGVRGAGVSALTLSGCVVPAGARLSFEGDSCMERMLTYGMIGIAIFAIGISQACLDESIAYSTEREAFGRPIAKFQEVHFKVADMKVQSDSARQLLYKVCWMLDRGDAIETLPSVLKLFASEAAAICAHEAVQIHGGKGYLDGTRVERLARDARLAELVEGTSEIQRVKIAEDLIERY